jgi:hypothetical protein
MLEYQVTSFTKHQDIRLFVEEIGSIPALVNVMAVQFILS